MLKKLIPLIAVGLIFFSCSGGKKHKEYEIDLRANTETVKGSDNKENTPLITRPNTVLKTSHPEHRLITVYKEKRTKNNSRYIDGNYYYHSYPDHAEGDGNNWHYHFMPGFEAVYGFNMYNIAHYNTTSMEKKFLFDHSVLIKTLYYPSFEKDTLNNQPVSRNYYMVSVYNEDTNNDSTINAKDLRRFFAFDLDINKRTPLIPNNYSVLSSEYDPQNDFMYVFARLDKNNNGTRDEDEPVHIFYVDLKIPDTAKRLY